jgi:hypothetical protein
MFAAISKLFTGSKKPQPKNSSFKPGFEYLEAREVLSTATGGMHTVAPPAGHVTEQIYFYIDAHTHLLKENSSAINGTAGTPAAVQLLSAGHGAKGEPDVFVTAGDGSFWKFDAGTWTKLLKPTADQVESFAAVDGGRAYAVLENVKTGGISLDEYDGASWHKIPVIGTPRSVDAVTDTSNRDVAFVLNTDGSMYDYGQFNPGSSFLSDKLFNAPHLFGARITEYSAGLDAQGDANVYATIRTAFGFSNLFRNREGSSPNGWDKIASGTTYSHFSATDNGAVWLAGKDNSVFELDKFGKLVPGSQRGNAFSATISAATFDDVYFVSSDGSLTQWVNSPNVGWESIELASPGSVQH